MVIQYLSGAADEAEDLQLAKLIRKGVAIHNSGLSPSDRGLVERAFLSGRYGKNSPLKSFKCRLAGTDNIIVKNMC